MKRMGAFTMLLLMGVSTPAFAQSDSARYTRCLALANGNPPAALADATAWSKNGGGSAAEHCAALALIGLNRFADAATRLDALARSRTPTGMGMRAEIFGQAGNAWIMAGNAARAVSSLQSALTLSGNDPELFADLARAEALRRNWREVVLDLNAALSLRPRRNDLLLLRASAYRALRNYDSARKDLDAALKIKPGDGPALLERGLLKRDAGDLGGARRDLAEARRAGPASVARAAQEQFDLIGPQN